MEDITQKNVDELMHNAPPRVLDRIAASMNVYKSIRWKHVSFVIPTNPIPSHRPRLCGYRVYVPGAAKNQSFFNKYVLPTLGDLFISTPCRVTTNLYIQTPKSFTVVQKVLAEMKILRPWGNVGDVDNYLKSILDQIQPNEKRGHVGIMANDSLVIDEDTHKYYSMTPRTEVTISYMGNIPDGLKKLLRLIKE